MRAERGASRPGKLRAEPSRFPANHAERRRAPRRGRKCRGHPSPRRPVPGALHRGRHVPGGPACAAARDPAALRLWSAPAPGRRVVRRGPSRRGDAGGDRGLPPLESFPLHRDLGAGVSCRGLSGAGQAARRVPGRDQRRRDAAVAPGRRTDFGAGGRRAAGSSRDLTMRGLYLDCFSGISGDMLLGALVDLGVEPAHLRSQLKKLRVSGYTLSAARVNRSGLAGTKVDVALTAARQPERRLKDIARIVQASRLSSEVRRRAMSAFETLVEAEARVHRVSRDKVHLHEVGAVDAIVDIVGAMIGLERLGWPRVVCSPLHVGRGMVTMEHGTFPVPGPATVEILKGKPCYATQVEGELVTPTGAALVATLAEAFGPMPPMRVRAIGYGAGTKQFDGHPNLLRAFLGDFLDEPVLRETVLVLETTIDDMNPQLYGHLMERLFAAGALEVFYTPIQMKKNRPGTKVTVICPEPKLEEVTTVVFRETTTIGFRYQPMGRIELARRIDTAKTPFGPIRMKVSVHNGQVVQATPEYEDCRRAALKTGAPLKEIQRLAAARYAPPRGTAEGLAAWARPPVTPPRTRRP